MLTSRTLQRINNRPTKVSLPPLLAVGGGTLVLSALLYVFEILPRFAILIVVGGGMLLVLLLYMAQKAKTTIKLSYKGKLDDKTASRFYEVQEALEGLVSSEGLWSLPVSSKPPKAGEVAPTPEREPARVGMLLTPGIKADVPIWGIEAGDGSIFFFPEGTLYYKNDRYEPVSYDALRMTFSSGRYFEEEDLRPTRRSLRWCGASANRTEAPTPATKTITSRSPSSTTTCSTSRDPRDSTCA